METWLWAGEATTGSGGKVREVDRVRGRKCIYGGEGSKQLCLPPLTLYSVLHASKMGLKIMWEGRTLQHICEVLVPSGLGV